MADTLESLEIEVRHSATGAADEINRVAEAIRSVSRALSRALPNMIAFNDALSGSAVNVTNNNITQVADNIGNVRTVAVHARQATNDVSRSISDMSKAASKAKSPLENFVASLKRIAFYRFIRSIIKEITKAISEGLEWAYQFSAGITTEGHRFAVALDSMKSASTQMKAQIGSAFAGLLAAIVPILNQIIALITSAANAISQLFAAITGGTYLKATQTSQKFADAMKSGGKAAKEWKNQLMGFDVINRLNEPNNGGGGGGTNKIDPSSLFEDTPIESKIKDFVDRIKKAINDGDWGGVGKIIGEKINEGLGKIALSAEGIGRKLVQFITNGFDMLIGFLDAVDWTYIGQIISSFLIGALSEATTWMANKDWENVGKTIWNAFQELISGFDFDGIAVAFFTFFGQALASAVQLVKGYVSETWDKIKEYFSEKTEEAGGNVVLGFLKGISDALWNVLVWVRDNVLIPFINAWREAFGIHSPSTVMEEIGNNIIEGLWIGIENKWNGFINFFHGLWNNLKTWWDSLSLGAFHIPVPHFNWSYEQASGLIAEALKFVGLPATIPHLNISWYAQGGFPEDGLFMANHNELVGQFSNGRTAVANNEQIIQGIESGVYRAMSSVMSNQQSNGRDIRVYLDGKEIGAASRRYERSMNRATGVSMA